MERELQLKIEKIERQLDRLNAKINTLLEHRKNDWISEEEAMQLSRRSKQWLRVLRKGKGDMPPALIEGRDWKAINNRMPMYNRERLEKLLFV